MKRYIASTGQVYIVNEGRPSEITDGLPDINTFDNALGVGLGDLHNAPKAGVQSSDTLSCAALSNDTRRNKPAFGFEMGDLTIIVLLFFLYRESGDEEFLIVLAFFALGIFGN